MLKNKKRIALLGSTGSVGKQTLDIINQHSELFGVELLSANKNYNLLFQQAVFFSPKYVVINDLEGFRFLQKNLSGKKTKVFLGPDSLCETIKGSDLDLVVSAIVGSAGLLPTIAAIESNINIALANKEVLVVAGELIMKMAKKNRVSILPIDSEHSALFQCLVGEDPLNINRLILTASGGNQLSHELDEFKHGAFTYYLLEAMKGNGDNDKDGIVTVNEAYQYVSNAVPKITSQNQFPQLFGGGGNVVLGKSNRTEVAMNLPTRNFKGGRLIVQVKPAEAEILIDGVSRGQGPIMNTVLSEGSYNVRVRMNNYMSQSKNIMIGKSSLNQLKFGLKKPEEDDFITPPP